MMSSSSQESRGVAVPQERTGRQIAQKLGSAVLFGACALLPPAVGATRGLTEPVTVTFAPGISAETTIQKGDATVVDFGPLTGQASFPMLHSSQPIIGNLAAHLKVNPLDFPRGSKPEALGLYTAIFQHTNTSIEQPLVKEIQHNVVTGIAEGLLVDSAGLVGWGSLNRKRRKKQLQQAQATAADSEHEAAIIASFAKDSVVYSSWKAVTDSRETSSHPNVGRRSVAAGAAAFLLLGVGVSDIRSELTTVANAPMIDAQPLSPELIDLSPQLKNAAISGPLLQLFVNEGSQRVLSYTRGIDNGNKAIVRDIDRATAEQRAHGELGYLNNPAYVTVVAISDQHCNLAYENSVLPAIMKAYTPDVMAIIGDIDISRGELPFEQLCVSELQASLQPTKERPKHVSVVAVGGNHDSSTTSDELRHLQITGSDGKPYNPVSVLDEKSDYRATVNGLTFVGSSDPRQSSFGTKIQPANKFDQSVLLAAQGHQLADVACAETKKDGIAPTVLAHDAQATFATLERGCSTIVLSGHTHHQLLPTAYDSSYSFTQGTSSGVGAGEFTEYALPKTAATATIFVYDARTKLPVGYYNLTITTDGQAQASKFQTLATVAADETGMAQVGNFLKRFDSSSMQSPVEANAKLK